MSIEAGVENEGSAFLLCIMVEDAAFSRVHPKLWRFILIVSSDEASFELQHLGGTAQGEWAGKVHQYALGLDVKIKVVFRLASGRTGVGVSGCHVGEGCSHMM